MAHDVLDRVRKLLALAGSPNLNEATLAASKAQALIERHRLQDLLEAETQADQDPVVERVIECARRLRRWKVVLAAGLSRVNGSLAYTRDVGRETELVLVGRADDLESIEALYEGLVPRLQWLSADHGGKRDKRWHDDFRVGAAATIVRRLHADATASRAELDATSLAVIEPALTARQRAVEAYASDHLRLKPGRGVRVDADAYERGRAAGQTVGLKPK